MPPLVLVYCHARIAEGALGGFMIDGTKGVLGLLKMDASFFARSNVILCCA